MIGEVKSSGIVLMSFINLLRIIFIQFGVHVLESEMNKLLSRGRWPLVYVGVTAQDSLRLQRMGIHLDSVWWYCSVGVIMSWYAAGTRIVSWHFVCLILFIMSRGDGPMIEDDLFDRSLDGSELLMD